MKAFDREHEETVARQILSHVVNEAQLTPEHLQAVGETFGSERAAFLMKVLSKATARGLAIIERISENDLSEWFSELFDAQLTEARDTIETVSLLTDKTEN